MSSPSPAGPVMKPFWYRFCWVLMFTLDRIPRYGRLYSYQKPDGIDIVTAIRRGAVVRVKEWRFQRRGLWGLHLVLSMGMMWDFIRETEWRRAERNRRSAP